MSHYPAIFRLALLVAIITGPEALQAQGAPPVIENYQIQRTSVSGRDGLAFTCEVRNVDRVRLLEDGREIPARIQLPDGSFGWPPSMPAFKTTGTDGAFTLVAENKASRVEARGSYGEKGCFAWLTPPGTHWTRCRKGGIVAAKLSTAPAQGEARGTASGRVTSD